MSTNHERRIRALEEAIASLRAAGRPRWQEGTWTPTFIGSTTPVTYTYLTQTGYYQRYNNVIFVWADVSISAITGAPVGNIRISGLPFEVADVTAPAMLLVSNLDYPAGAVEIAAQFATGASEIQLAYQRDNQAVLAYPAASFTNVDALIRVAGMYLTA
jgi:hypothetical protein